jgi:hypothetical protein
VGAHIRFVTYFDTDSGEGGGGGFLATQVDTRSTSLRTPVALKSLSTAYQRRRATDPLGVSCNTIPDTRSTTSRPSCNPAAKLAATERSKHGQQPVSPIASNHSKDDCEQVAVRDGLNAPEGRDAGQTEATHAKVPPVVTADKALVQVDTNRVLFPSPQTSVGHPVPSSSPAEDAPNEAMQRSCPCAALQKEQPFAPPNSRVLTASEQDILQEFYEEGVRACFVVGNFQFHQHCNAECSKSCFLDLWVHMGDCVNMLRIPFHIV